MGAGVYRPPSAGGALARSLRALTVGTLKAFNERQDVQVRDGLGEIDQQYQLAVAGSIEDEAKWAEFTVKFDAPFINGTEERNVPFLNPHFTYGTVMVTGRRLVISCNVISWTYDRSGGTDGLPVEIDYVTGCKLEVGVFRADDSIPAGDFKVELHLNFQGYGGANADEANPDADLTDDPSIGSLEGA